MSNMSDFMTMPSQSLRAVNTAESPSGNFERKKPKARPRDAINWTIKQTRHALLVNWREIRNSPQQYRQTGFNQIINLCEESLKDEIVVEDIAPEYRIGTGEPEVVIAAQAQIVSAFMGSVATRLPALPDHRLSLRGDCFDLRFYVGRTRPTDLPPFEDF